MNLDSTYIYRDALHVAASNRSDNDTMITIINLHKLVYNEYKEQMPHWLFERSPMRNLFEDYMFNTFKDE